MFSVWLIQFYHETKMITFLFKFVELFPDIKLNNEDNFRFYKILRNFSTLVLLK